MRLAGVPRRDRQPRDRADRRQRLAAEAERADREQVVVRQLRGGVALDREREVVARHARAVVADADQPPAAAVGDDIDAGRAGVERVLDQLLDDARRPLDHLAGGDAVDDGFGELADGHRDLIRAGRNLGAGTSRREWREPSAPAIQTLCLAQRS